jgi:transposase
MGRQDVRDLDSKRRHPRQLTDAEWEQIANEVLTEDEQQVRQSLAKGLSVKEIAAELDVSDNTALSLAESILVKLTRAVGISTPPDPPPRRPARLRGTRRPGSRAGERARSRWETNPSNDERLIRD